MGLSRTGKDLRQIARELRKMDDKELLRRFRKDLRASAAPLVPAVRRSIRAIPSKRPYTSAGLRGQMSRATNLQVKTTGRQASVIIRVDGRKMPPKAKALQAYMEGVKPRWRHPVYGHNWYVQQPPSPYFFRTVASAGPRARAAVARVLNKVSRDIT